MDDKTQFVLNYDEGYGEKEVIISFNHITFKNKNLIDADRIKTKPDIVFFLVSQGDPPFEKGSKILKQLREESKIKFNAWKKIISFDRNNYGLISFDFNLYPELDTRSWGLWVCEEKYNDTLLMIINFPVWIIDRIEQIEKKNEILSKILRGVYTGVDSYLSYELKTVKTLLISGIGGNTFDQSRDIKLMQNLIKTTGNVTAKWLSIHNKINQVIISYGKPDEKGDPIDISKRKTKLAEIASKSWQEEKKIQDENEKVSEEVKILRKDNSNQMKILLREIKHMSNKTKLVFEESIGLFKNQENVHLSSDLVQSRKILEAIIESSIKLVNKDLKISHNLADNIEKLNKTGQISNWIYSMFHTLRIFGNNGAHFKDEEKKYPERLFLRDLVVVHGTLSRILYFFRDFQKIKKQD
tara:strand:+ start:1189 stop:2424 length:1236 start_codon:yes stop_codon:yes gene_type:complete